MAIATFADADSDLAAKVSVPWLGEIRYPLERIATALHPVFWGLGIPRGNGSGVVLVPGFMGIDFYLATMHDWLRRIGYKPYMSAIGPNARCLDVLVGLLEDTVKLAYKETGGKITLVGHSLGGTLALIVGYKNPDLVERVFTLAAPIRPVDGAIKLNPLTVMLTKIVRFCQAGEGIDPECLTPRCNCPSLRALRGVAEPPVKITAVYTKSDGVVDYRCTMSGDPEIDKEVSGCHMALPFNPQVYSIVANVLGCNRTYETAVA